MKNRRFLLVTEKNSPSKLYQDGGFQLVQTLKAVLREQLDVMHFGCDIDKSDPMAIEYPSKNTNRFLRRIENRDYIAEQILNISHHYTDIIFVHLSMLFGFINGKPDGNNFWVFPMFLTPSYINSNEYLPNDYINLEKQALRIADRIISPSAFERSQICTNYSIPIEKIKVVPRGINRNIISHKKRELPFNGDLIFGSVASIKQQKNTVGLIQLFADIKRKIPNAFLKIIGPIQDTAYFNKVLDEIEKFNLSNSVEFTGYIAYNDLESVLKNVQVHITTSHCETFGRSIFETLAFGIPNLCKKDNLASWDYLQNYPFVKFFTSNYQALQLLDEIIDDYNSLSQMTTIIGDLFCEEKMNRILAAEFESHKELIVADFDGTILHKHDALKTAQSVDVFNSYSCRVICTSRSLYDIKLRISELNLTPDFIISWSGAVITNSNDEVLFLNEMCSTLDIKLLQKSIPVTYNEKVIQYFSDDLSIVKRLPKNVRYEQYDNRLYISRFNCTKLTAIQQLLNLIQWNGKIRCFGDSIHDYEFLNFYDGYLIQNDRTNPILKTSNCIF
jgi:glycosyltransferase involved in cell wall biosynthesis/hydroxymethylpyrimidine pyrophosphatase-like HAD family hydrolase